VTIHFTVDTNILLRLTVRDIPEQWELVKRLFSDSRVICWVPAVVVSEYVFALEHHYTLTRPQIRQMVLTLDQLPTLRWETAVIVKAVEAWCQHPKLSFVDCLLADWASDQKTVLLSFDKKLSTQTEGTQLVTEEFLASL
jgi:predicted nucleic-acid-binding protein